MGTDPTGNSGPYVTDGVTWAGFEDNNSILKKTKYVIENELGGVSAWTVDLDDFNNNCCSEPFPLLKAINRGLNRITSKTPAGNNCDKPVVVTPPPAVMSVTEDNGQAGIPMYTQESTTTSPWWTQPTTTKRPVDKTTTTRRPAVTSKKPSASKPPKESTAIPSPVNVMPVYVPNESCQNGEYKRYPGACNMYLVCVGNKFLEQPCPAGLHWNDQHKHCDWPESAKCETSPPKESELPEAPADVPVYDEVVTEKTTRATRPPKSTTKGSRPTKRTTPRRTTTTTPEPTTTERTTTTYSETTTMEYTTRKRTRKPTTTSTTTTMSTTSEKPSKKPSKCENGQYYSHKDCSKYYICNNNRKVPMNCPDGLQFSQKYKICDLESNVKCVSRKKYMKLLQHQYKSTGIFTASLLRAQKGDACSDQKFLSYPGKCSLYLVCVHNQLLQMECSSGTVWNSDIQNCDWPQNTNCKDDPSLDEDGDIIEEEEEGEVQEENELEPVDESSEYVTPTISKPAAKPTAKPTTTPSKPPSKPSKPPKKPLTPAKDPTTALATIPVEDVVQPLTGKYKLVCYFTNWAWYRPGDGKYLPDDIDANLCTHIVYGFAVLGYDELIIKPHDSWADIDNRFYERVLALKSKGIKVSLAIGGWNDSAGDKYSRLVRNAAARAKFIRHVVEFLEKYGFDGKIIFF